jgi:hypothetical protein
VKAAEKPQPPERMCPACGSTVPAPDDVLAEHDSGGALQIRCPASGWKIKGEHK